LGHNWYTGTAAKFLGKLDFMSTDSIVALLIVEREKLNKAIAALQGGGTEAGNLSKSDAPKKRFISAATRRKMALGQKRRHAAKQAAK
jgi:hypothetical protein